MKPSLVFLPGKSGFVNELRCFLPSQIVWGLSGRAKTEPVMLPSQIVGALDIWAGCEKWDARCAFYRAKTGDCLDIKLIEPVMTRAMAVCCVRVRGWRVMSRMVWVALGWTWSVGVFLWSGELWGWCGLGWGWWRGGEAEDAGGFYIVFLLCHFHRLEIHEASGGGGRCFICPWPAPVLELCLPCGNLTPGRHFCWRGGPRSLICSDNCCFISSRAREYDLARRILHSQFNMPESAAEQLLLQVHWNARKYESTG